MNDLASLAPRPDDAPDDESALRPQPHLLALAVLGLVGCVLTAGFAYRYTVIWERERAGHDIREQRATITDAPWFREGFTLVVERLREVFPPGTRLFLDPTRFDKGDNQKARFFLYLTYYAHPVEIYVRKPELASGTLVDYPRWNDYHRANINRLSIDEAHAIEELGIEWKLRMPFAWEFFSNEVYLERLVDGEWVPYDLWTFRPKQR